VTDPISALRDDLDGRVIAPDDPGYDDARALFYAGFDRRPAAVVRASSADDVALEATRVIESPAVAHLRYRVIRGEHAT
jgi:hypothetical protein